MTNTDTTTAAPSTAVAVPTAPHELANMTLFDPQQARDLYEMAETVAAARMLPVHYRNSPADVLIAFNLGLAVGITPTQALYEIYVVNGRPSMSANLMAALVRRAGHKLHVNGDEKSCTATLTRRDAAPDEPPFEFTWTIEMAHRAGLTGKDTWRHYPATMLRSRATSEVCKMGASECLAGITLTIDEAKDMVVDGEVVARAAKPTGIDAIRQAVQPEQATPPPEVPAGSDVLEGEVVEEVVPITEDQRKRITALWADLGVTSNPTSKQGISDRLELIHAAIGVRPPNVRALSMDQADRLIAQMEVWAADRQREADQAAQNEHESGDDTEVGEGDG